MYIFHGTMIAFIDEYIEYLRVHRRYSERTVLLYSDAVERFFASALSPGNSPTDSQAGSSTDDHAPEDGADVRQQLNMLTTPRIRGFVASNLKEGMSSRSVNLLLSGIGSYCRYLLKRGLLQSNPVAGVYRPKEKHRLPQFYTKDDLDAYLNSPVGDDYPSVRDRTMLLLLYSTGMRRAEVAGLKLQNLDLSRKVFKITGKGAKEREIPVIDCLYDKILLYLQTRKSSFKDCTDDSFFLTDRGRPLYLSFVNNVVKKELMTFKEFGGKKSPHILRHSLATHLLNDGAGLNSIKEVLGHSSLAATQVYTHNSFEQLKKIYITAHPRAKKRR